MFHARTLNEAEARLAATRSVYEGLLRLLRQGQWRTFARIAQGARRHIPALEAQCRYLAVGVRRGEPRPGSFFPPESTEPGVVLTFRH